MNKNPLVSIIIPVYNDAEFLRECLDSAVNQTLKDIEIICVNDASTDNSLEIMNEYAAKDKRVRVINRSENGSALMARKDGIMAARGDFTMFLDGDDYLVPNACETAYNLILKNDVDILRFSYIRHNYGEDGSISNIQVVNPDSEGSNVLHGREMIQNFCLVGKNIDSYLWNKIFKTNLLKIAHSQMDDFYCFYYNDLYEYYYILYYTKKMVEIPTDPLYTYCFGRGGCGHITISLEEFKKFCQMKQNINRIQKFLERENALDEQEKYLSAWEKHLRKSLCWDWLSRINTKDIEKGVKILYLYWNEKNDIQEIIFHLLTMLRNHINRVANLEKTNKNLLIQLNDENKNARIKELQDWSEEQLKAKEWFLSQIKYKDERIAELEKVSGFCYKILTKIFRILRGKN